MKHLSKPQLIAKLEDLEQELHNEQNSSEYWSHEYHKLLEEFNKLKNDNNPVVTFLKNCSIVQEIELTNLLQTV